MYVNVGISFGGTIELELELEGGTNPEFCVEELGCAFTTVSARFVLFFWFSCLSATVQLLRQAIVCHCQEGDNTSLQFLS